MVILIAKEIVVALQSHLQQANVFYFVSAQAVDGVSEY